MAKKRNMLEWFEEKWDCTVTKNRGQFLELVRFYGVDKSWLRFDTTADNYGITYHSKEEKATNEVAAFETRRIKKANGYGYITEVTTFNAPISQAVLDYLFPDQKEVKENG